MAENKPSTEDIDHPGPMRFYLDESGSTGDVAKPGERLDFGEQPIFVLAAIGCSDDDALAQELRRLAKIHQVLGREISSTALVDKPEFAADLATFLIATDCPVFVELMDKRYVIIMNLVNQVVLPPVLGFDEGSKAMPMRRILAEMMAAHLPADILAAYARACETSNREDLDKVFAGLLAWAETPMLGDLGQVLHLFVEDSYADFVQETDPEAHKNWLPIPDKSVTGRQVSMLPGLSSLTNIYGRINKYRRGRLAGTALIHDEHMLFGNILSDAKALMETLSAENAFLDVPNADYRLTEHSSLEFARSDTPGIQAADVIAGFVMRYFRDVATGRPPTIERRRAMARIDGLSFAEQARGIHFVMSETLMNRAGYFSNRIEADVANLLSQFGA